MDVCKDYASFLVKFRCKDLTLCLDMEEYRRHHGRRGEESVTWSIVSVVVVDNIASLIGPV